jgi:hypothetical protein
MGQPKHVISDHVMSRARSARTMQMTQRAEQVFRLKTQSYLQLK